MGSCWAHLRSQRTRCVVRIWIAGFEPWLVHAAIQKALRLPNADEQGYCPGPPGVGSLAGSPVAHLSDPAPRYGASPNASLQASPRVCVPVCLHASPDGHVGRRATRLAWRCFPSVWLSTPLPWQVVPSFGVLDCAAQSLAEEGGMLPDSAASRRAIPCGRSQEMLLKMGASPSGDSCTAAHAAVLPPSLLSMQSMCATSAMAVATGPSWAKSELATAASCAGDLAMLGFESAPPPGGERILRVSSAAAFQGDATAMRSAEQLHAVGGGVGDVT